MSIKARLSCSTSPELNPEERLNADLKQAEEKIGKKINEEVRDMLNYS